MGDFGAGHFLVCSGFFKVYGCFKNLMGVRSLTDFRMNESNQIESNSFKNEWNPDDGWLVARWRRGLLYKS